MSERLHELRNAWNERREHLGPTKRAVLFKRFPSWLNEAIHRQHVEFVADNVPHNARLVLDVGCGYGRISREIALRRPGLKFQGVDLCAQFASDYERTVGPCFNGAIQDFHTEETFDLIIVVTTLMYLTDDEQQQVLQDLWSALARGGRIACIEPASELFILWRRLTGKASASPTGGTVRHFLAQDLRGRFSALAGARILSSCSVRLLPLVDATAVHHCVAFEKQ